MNNFKTNLVNVDTKGHTNRPLSTPIYQTSTFEFDSAAQGGNRFALVEDGMIYTRLGNPTTQELEKKLAVLEHAEEAICFGSGMGAISAVLFELLQPGDELVIQRALYGCTSDLVTGMLTKWGVVVKMFDESKATFADIAELITDKTKVVYLEALTNPTLSRLDPKVIYDLKDMQPLYNYTIVVDNTFASPYCFNPIDHGADVVIHSMTKYIAGHLDVLAGCVCSSHDICTKIRWSAQKNIGSIMSPNDAYLTLRGLQTMAVRMNQSMWSTQCIVDYLNSPENADLIVRVNYPQDECEGYKGYGSCFSVVSSRPTDILTKPSFMCAFSLSSLGTIA